jgi:adenosylcobinamide-phosphate synthase
MAASFYNQEYKKVPIRGFGGSDQYLHLDSKNASQVYKKDRRKSPSPNSAQTQSVCAGALGIQLGSDEYYGGQLVRKPVIGRNLKPCEPNDIFWANQLLLGTSFYAMLFTAVIRTALFFVI